MKSEKRENKIQIESKIKEGEWNEKETNENGEQ